MEQTNNYIEVNKALWDEKTKHHVSSAFYKMDDFMNGVASLNDIELSLLGDVKGKTTERMTKQFRARETKH